LLKDISEFAQDSWHLATLLFVQKFFRRVKRRQRFLAGAGSS
jgi:hypothetical protein